MKVKRIGIVILIISVIFFAIGQSQVSAYEKEVKTYYGNGFLGEYYYDSDRLSYYAPGEQMRDIALPGIVLGIIFTVSGVVISRKKAPLDLLSKD